MQHFFLGVLDGKKYNYHVLDLLDKNHDKIWCPHYQMDLFTYAKFD